MCVTQPRPWISGALSGRLGEVIARLFRTVALQPDAGAGGPALRRAGSVLVGEALQGCGPRGQG